MTVEELKKWVNGLPDGCLIEVNHYRWEDLKHEQIRAVYTSSPQRTFDSVLNLGEEL